ncbi:NXPE family member 3 isoform X1 [Amia ocellicauda]|uniref:NXPE family member 3 isoform X1 n=1 Tax=Amia ocellicauda TaxID=2972642 RepID=UPI003463FF69
MSSQMSVLSFSPPQDNLSFTFIKHTYRLCPTSVSSHFGLFSVGKGFTINGHRVKNYSYFVTGRLPEMRKAALPCFLISLVILSVYLYCWEEGTQPQSKRPPSPVSQHQWDQIHLSPEEWQALREALRWPSPDRPVTSLNDTTDPRHCFYYVENLRDNYTVGDTLNVTLVARDFSGNPKSYGGDFFQARLHSQELKASTYGSVQDHCNGTYTVHFSLLWPGQARISLRLIHSSEAVQVLLRHREADPNKVSFRGYFEEGGRSETVVCNAQRSGSRCCCEYKDPATGEMWFCQKPAALPCHALVYHSAGTYQAKLTDLDKSLLDTKLTNVDVGIPGTDPKIHILPLDTESRQEQKCAPGLDTPVPAGFYFQDRWTSLVCSARSFSSAEQIVGCLKDKQLYMMGDSTLRQWFEYLQTTVPNCKILPPSSSEAHEPSHLRPVGASPGSGHR